LLLALGQIPSSPANGLANDITGPVHCLGAGLATAAGGVSGKLTAASNGLAGCACVGLRCLSDLAHNILLLGVNHKLYISFGDDLFGTAKVLQSTRMVYSPLVQRTMANAREPII
jgi:hypothetical protein